MSGQLATATGQSFLTIKKRCEKLKSLTQDILVTANELEFCYPEDEDEPFLKREGYRNLYLTERSYNQLASRLSMSGSYFRKVEAKEQEKHFNMWLSTSTKQYWLRAVPTKVGYRVRAILPKDFPFIDNADLFGLIQPYLEDGTLVVLMNTEVEGSLFMRFLVNWRFSQMASEDPIDVGLSLVNSEVGSRTYTADTILYRAQGENTLMDRPEGKPGMDHKHIYLGPALFKVRLWEMIERVRQTGSQAVTMLDDTRDRTLLSSELTAVYQDLNRSRAVPKSFMEKIQAPEKVYRTWFEFLMAFTSLAQSYRIDRRMSIEVEAGGLLRRSLSTS